MFLRQLYKFEHALNMVWIWDNYGIMMKSLMCDNIRFMKENVLILRNCIQLGT